MTPSSSHHDDGRLALMTRAISILRSETFLGETFPSSRPSSSQGSWISPSLRWRRRRRRRRHEKRNASTMTMPPPAVNCCVMKMLLHRRLVVVAVVPVVVVDPAAAEPFASSSPWPFWRVSASAASFSSFVVTDCCERRSCVYRHCRICRRRRRRGVTEASSSSSSRRVEERRYYYHHHHCRDRRPT